MDGRHAASSAKMRSSIATSHQRSRPWSIITIGLDLAKNVFQVHGIDAAGKVLVRRQLRRRRCPAVFWRIAALPCRHGGLRYRSSLGS